jgi:anthranilate synthase component 2
MIILIDNYDSFVYNLYQYIGERNPEIEVYRNDKITAGEVLAKNPSHIVLSPGPGYPKDAGICVELIQKNKDIPLLGVCLGHQAIGEAFGAHIVHAPEIMHGKADMARVTACSPILDGMGDAFQVARYHSLTVEPESVPDCLAVTARTEDGCIMAMAHRERPIYGVQFHPESVLTPMGMRMIENFLNGKN